MSIEEFKKRAKELGYSDEYIEEIISNYEEDKKEGINTDLSIYLIELPEEY